MSGLREKLIKRLAKLGVEDQPLPGRTDGFSSLCWGGKAFAHFHSDIELDLRLTKAVIAREGLIHPAGSAVHPKRSATSHWIELPLTTAAELERATHLVKLAIEQMGSSR